MENASKGYHVSFAATATGDGYWGMEAGTVVKFRKIDILVLICEDGHTITEVRAYHDADAAKLGLCYTDSGIESAVAAFIASHPEMGQVLDSRIGGSEQGMQDTFTLSMDANVKDFDKLAEFDFCLES